VGLAAPTAFMTAFMAALAGRRAAAVVMVVVGLGQNAGSAKQRQNQSGPHQGLFHVCKPPWALMFNASGQAKLQKRALTRLNSWRHAADIGESAMNRA
jgi:hypothetical protein